ncbi:MAG: aldo/keto reductase [Saccharofermentanales bacterium]
MKYKTISGLVNDVSVVCYGAGGFHFAREDENKHMMDLYLENGGNLFDTANIYGRWLASGTNESEKVIGRWIDERINRDRQYKRSDIIISTKGAHPDLDKMNTPRMSESEIRHDLEDSLNSLNTDYIDIYWLHRDAPQLPVEAIIEPLMKFKNECKILTFGLSNWTTERIMQVEKFMKENHFDGLFGIQNRWGFAAYNPEASEDATLVSMTMEEYQWHVNTKIPSMPYSGMAKGYFTKLFKTGKEEIDSKLLEYYDNPLNDARFNALVEISLDTGKPVSQIALAFMLKQPFPVFPIVGFANESQLFDAVEATDIDLTKEQIIYLSQGRPY